MFLLYIDPGTGSMLFSVFIGLAAASYFLFRTLIIRAKTLFLGKNKAAQNKYPIVIYNEAIQYCHIFNPILEEFENREIDIQYLTSAEKDPVFERNYTYIHSVYIGSGNKAFATLNFLEADVCLMTTPAIEVYQLKRSKLCKHYSHIIHDTGDATCYRLFGIDWFNSIFLSGEYQIKDIRELEKLRSLPQKELFVVGSTYLDYYENKIKEIPIDEYHKFTVLISPSWGAGALLSSLGDKLLDCFIDSDWRIIVRPHPQSRTSEELLLKRLEEKYSAYIWDYKRENIDSLSKTDIMISDFSSIIFDYVFLFNRPVIYHNSGFKKEMYDAGDFEHDPWKFGALKRFGIELSEKDLPNLKSIIQKAITDASLSEEIIKAKETAWQNRQNSAKAVVDALIKIK